MEYKTESTITKVTFFKKVPIEIRIGDKVQVKLNNFEGYEEFEGSVIDIKKYKITIIDDYGGKELTIPYTKVEEVISHEKWEWNKSAEGVKEEINRRG